MADDLRRIIDDPNLSNEEIAKRVRENLGNDENELFVKLDNDPQMTDADLHLLLSYDLDKLDEVFGFLLDKYDMSEEDLIEYAKYKRKQYGVDVETGKSEFKESEEIPELFVKLDNDPQMTDADLHLLLSYDLDKLDEVFGFLLDKYDMSEEDLIEYAKYKRKQYGVDVEIEKSESKGPEKIVKDDKKTLFDRIDKEINNAEKEEYAKGDREFVLKGDLNDPRFKFLARSVNVSLDEIIEYAKYKRSQASKDDIEKTSVATKNENVAVNNDSSNVNIADRLKQINELFKTGKPISGELIDERNKLIEKRDKMYEEYISVVSRLQEIEKKISIAIKNDEIIPNELNNERTKLIERKRELLPQVEDMLNINDNKKKPRKLSDYVEEQKQEKEKQEKEKADDNEIVSERDGSFLSKAKGFIDKVKNLSTKGKIIGLAGLAAAGIITAGVYMAVKHGDVQTLNDALHQAGMHIQDAANQLNPDPSGIDPSAIGQHIDTTFVSSGDAANYAHVLKPIEEDFQYDIQNLVDSHNNIIPAHGMSYDELIELIKNGNDIASVQVGGDAAHIDGHLNINDILNAYDATVKSGGAVR